MRCSVRKLEDSFKQTFDKICVMPKPLSWGLSSVDEEFLRILFEKGFPTYFDWMRELKRYSTQLFEIYRGTSFQVSKLPVVRMPSHPASWHRRLIKVVILLWTSQHLPPFLLSDGIRWMSLCYCWGQHCFRIGRRKVGRSIGVVREVLTLLTRGYLQVACVFFRLLPMRFYVRFSQFDTGWASFDCPPLERAFLASFMAHRWSTNLEDMKSSSRESNHFLDL